MKDGSSSLSERYSAPVSRAVRVQPAPNSTPPAVTRKSGARSLSRSQGLMVALTLRVRVLIEPLKPVAVEVKVPMVEQDQWNLMLVSETMVYSDLLHQI